MRKFLILLSVLLPLAAAHAVTYRVQDVPNVQLADRTRYVSNPDGILSAEAVARIDSVCGALRTRAIAQVAVVAVDDISGGDTFSFAVELFRSWGVGRAENDNGLGMLLVKDLREIRFVTGGGLEGVLPDAICKRIQLKYMLPAFREGDYSRGMVAGIEAVGQLLEGSELDLGGVDEPRGKKDSAPLWIILGVVVVFFVIAIIGYFRSKRCPRCHKFTLALQSNKIVEETRSYRVEEYTYVCSSCGETVRRKSKSLRDDNLRGGGGGMVIGGGHSFGGRGFGGGSFGGGFGGGSFGGGGAGSGW